LPYGIPRMPVRRNSICCNKLNGGLPHAERRSVEQTTTVE
jgi:hypothetical protein